MSGTNFAIPADQIVDVVPSVLPAGGTGLNVIGLFVTNSTRSPLGDVPSFASATDVATYYGALSIEAMIASVYFGGFDNSNVKPGKVRYTSYNVGPARAWLRGGPLGLTLTQLQAITGVITVSIDGTPHTSSSFDLSGATSFSAAAEIISQALGQTGPAGAALTGVIAGTTLTASAVTGTIAVGQELRGAGVTAGTLISAQLTGTAGAAGTYTVSASQSVASEAMTTNTPTVTYDALSGAFYIQSGTTGATSTIDYATGTAAASLALTLATGAVVSQGAVAATPAGIMNGVTAATRDWATFALTFDPDNGSGHTLKEAFAIWSNAQDNNYLYIPWDTDAAPTVSENATASFGRAIMLADYTGVFRPIYSPARGAPIAAFTCSIGASTDFDELAGRTSFKFRRQSGLAPDVMNATIATNLLANGYNFYGVWSTADQQFNFLTDGAVSGPFKWADSFINQIWLNSELQLAMMILMTTAKAIPYNEAGRELVRAAGQDPINRAKNFGAFVTGVQLSEAQKAEVNNAVGAKADVVLTTQGYYFQVLDASPEVRQNRGSFPCTLWYTDGQSLQRLSIASVNVQ